MVHFVEEADTDHQHPQWQVVSPDEMVTVRREHSFSEPRYPFRHVSWLCNHCSDYLAPQPPFRFGSRVMSGSKRDAIRHVKTECVRSLAVLPGSALIFSQAQHRRSCSRRGLILIPNSCQWYYGLLVVDSRTFIPV